MSGASSVAKLATQQADLIAYIERVTERITTYEIQLASFEESVKTMAEPLYDHEEFERARRDMEKTLQDHQSPNMDSGMASAMSLLGTLNSPAVSGVVKDREKTRQTRYATANKFVVAIQNNLDKDRASLARFRTDLEEVDNLLKEAAEK